MRRSACTMAVFRHTGQDIGACSKLVMGALRIAARQPQPGGGEIVAQRLLIADFGGSRRSADIDAVADDEGARERSISAVFRIPGWRLRWTARFHKLQSSRRILWVVFGINELDGVVRIDMH